MATFMDLPEGTLPGEPEAMPSGGPLMTLRDWAAFASAPKQPFGTQVSVRKRPVEALAGVPDHMFVHYDDGQTQLIARGGPSEEGVPFVPGVLDGANRVLAEVTPERSSRDYGKPYRTIARTFVPGLSANEAAAGARSHAAAVDQGGNAYSPWSNSNSYAADVAQPLLGFRPGDFWTWGSGRHLTEQPRRHSEPGNVFTGPVWSDDLTPAIQIPPY